VNYLRGDIVLFPYPFTDLQAKKVRPAVIVSLPGGKYEDVFIVPLTSRIHNLSDGEFLLGKWKAAGLNVPTAVKRGCVLVDTALILTKIGNVQSEELFNIEKSLKKWLYLI